jgi:hypothetical protein
MLAPRPDQASTHQWRHKWRTLTFRLDLLTAASSVVGRIGTKGSAKPNGTTATPACAHPGTMLPLRTSSHELSTRRGNKWRPATCLLSTEGQGFARSPRQICTFGWRDVWTKWPFSRPHRLLKSATSRKANFTRATFICRLPREPFCSGSRKVDALPGGVYRRCPMIGCGTVLHLDAPGHAIRANRGSLLAGRPHFVDELAKAQP